MIKKNVAEVNVAPMNMEGAEGILKRAMLTQADCAPNFNLRVFDIEPGGHSPRHSHPYEHEIFILEGKGEVLGDGSYQPVEVHDAILIEPDEEHQVRNNGPGLLRFICLVPQSSGQDLEAGCGKSE